MTDITLNVEGMSCQHCVMRVKKAVEGLKGVQGSDVRIGLVKVTFDEKTVTREEIVAAIMNAGYRIAAQGT
jgi:copper chaperone